MHEGTALFIAMTLRLTYIFVFTCLIFSCSKPKEEKQSTPEKTDELIYTIQRSFPHDTQAFTQGLEIHEGKLYESTGQNNSWIGIVDINTGIAEKKVILPAAYFGEGITIMNNKVYQLTWQSKIGFVYDLTTFKKLKDFSYDTEGWGLTHDSTYLIMSDGTDKIRLLDTVSLKPVKTIAVTYQGKPLRDLNELEYIHGHLYANIWQTNRIAKIDLSNGEVVGLMDLSELVSQARMVNPSIDVLNGIAWHAGTKSMLVTGKYWPFIYSIKFKESDSL